MKQLSQLTLSQAKHICKLVNEPFISYITNNDGKWKNSDLEIQINTTSTLNGNRDDSYIWIHKNGKIMLWRNNGDWGGHRYEEINTLPIIDYLREQGYEFK